jgi:hypothetical protein
MSRRTRLKLPLIGSVAVFVAEIVGRSSSVSEKSSAYVQASMSSSKVLCLLGLVVGSEQYGLLTFKSLVSDMWDMHNAATPKSLFCIVRQQGHLLHF